MLTPRVSPHSVHGQKTLPLNVGVAGWLNRPVPEEKKRRESYSPHSEVKQDDGYTYNSEWLPASQVPQEQRFTTIFYNILGLFRMLWLAIQRTSQITRTQRDGCLSWFSWRVHSRWLLSASSGLFPFFFFSRTSSIALERRTSRSMTRVRVPSGAREKQWDYLKSKMLYWLAVGVPNPRGYTQATKMITYERFKIL